MTLRELPRRILGLDLAAEAKNTGAVVLVKHEVGRWEALPLEGTATDDDLVAHAHLVDVIGVDSPLGWPEAFVGAVSAHQAFEPWPGTPDRSTLTHRETDRAIRTYGSKASLSVSADKLGSVAMRCALLQRRWAEEVWETAAPRDGSGWLVETYPAAAFNAWAVPCRGYKSRDRTVDARGTRAAIMTDLQAQAEQWLDLTTVSSACVSSDHVIDALACALVALAAKVEKTYQPDAHQLRSALREGWIHVPTGPLDELAAAVRAI